MPNETAPTETAVEEIDRLARELAFAVCEWLASDGDEEKFEVVDRLAGVWRTAVIRG